MKKKNSKKNLKIIMTAMLILYTLGMITIAVIPDLSNVKSISGQDKIIHFLEFFIFTILLLATLAIDEIKDYQVMALVIILIIVVISEAIQIPIIGRTFSVKDIIADLAGVTTGFIVFWLARLEWKQLKR